jgi:K(+)-stimulated pyrophosphate-energized sodium pump
MSANGSSGTKYRLGILLLSLLVFFPIALQIGVQTAEAQGELEVEFFVGELLIEEPVDGDTVTIEFCNRGESTRALQNLEVLKGGNSIYGPQNLVLDPDQCEVLVTDEDFSEGDTLEISDFSGVYFDETIKKPSEGSSLVWMILIGGLVGLGFAIYLIRKVMSFDKGTEKMREISDAIKEGAKAFLNTQYKTILIITVVFAVAFAVAIGFAVDNYYGLDGWTLGMMTSSAFLMGALFSAVSGYIGMHMAIRANIRCASASRRSYDESLRVAMWGGSVSGFAIVALSLLGVMLIYFIYGYGQDPRLTPLIIVGFGFGASLVALFAQLGGGIYTKAADVGADLVGKVEAGIPEDDPRNAAVIADLVGDNVGDCAGRGADLFESTAAENIGAMILGIALYPVFGINGIIFPLVARAFGLLACIVGVAFVKAKEDEVPMKPLNRGYYVASFLSALFFSIATYFMLGDAWLYYAGCGIIGILTSIAFVFITQYYTEARFKPVQEIAKASETGPATNILSGFSYGLETVFAPILVIASALLGAFFLGQAGGEAAGLNPLFAGLYGTAMATMGMLATCAYILAMDTYGPITDNAGGINEMSGDSPDEAKSITAKLDASGNTTKALTKGYAVGSAALAAFLLFSAYMTEAHLTSVDLAKPVVFVGAMMGAMMVFLFSAFAIRAVGKAASSIIEEVRRQFREMPGIMEGTQKPDYARCVDITTRGALREMVLPGLIAIFTPIAVGLLLRAEALGATLMVGTIAGVVLALVLNNVGGAWDNAKKYIEDGHHGGKGSDPHKASVIGDTVGDPFKDTAGPSLHIVIKLLSTITLVLAPLFI